MLSCLFQLLLAPKGSWLLIMPLQPLLPSSHGHLLCVPSTVPSVPLIRTCVRGFRAHQGIQSNLFSRTLTRLHQKGSFFPNKVALIDSRG